MPYLRRVINIRVSWRGRKKFRNILKKIIFFHTTEYIRHAEESDLLSSNFVIEVCGPKNMVDPICILLIALGGKYGGSQENKIDEEPDRFIQAEHG